MKNPQAVKQIGIITEDFRKLREKIDALIPKARTQDQIEAIKSLSRGIGGVRGCELCIARQSFGLDQEMIDINAAFKSEQTG